MSIVFKNYFKVLRGVDMSVFGERLKQLRIARNLMQKDVATDLKFSPRTYQSYELGDREANYENIVKLADYFEVSTDYLLGRSDNPERH